MTFRAIILGLLGATLICGLSYLNDAVMHQTYLVGNNMPISVYGTLILFLVLVNPVLARLGKRVALSGGEIAVILALTLAACSLPGSGLLRTFTSALVLPHHYAKTDPGWNERKVMERVPPQMIVDVSSNETVVLNGFVQGLGGGKTHIAAKQVPWYAWTRTFAFWLPLLFVFWIGIIALAVVVHRQWADHEQLPYPIAMFANALLPGGGEARSGVLRNRMFWVATGVILAIHLNNYACQWFPRYLIQVPTHFDFTALDPLFPTLVKGGGGWWPLMYVPIYFTVIAVAYFLATDVSLSLGLGGYLFTYLNGVFAGYGIALGSGSTYQPALLNYLGFGAYCGMLLAMIYTGRQYYRNVFQRALFLPARDAVEAPLVWAARIFMLCAGVFTVCLMRVGLDWQLALFVTLAMVMLFLVLSRILAETGVFFMQPYWFPAVILTGFVGATAVGPTPLLIMLLLTTVFLIDPRESLMPFVVNALKLVELKGVKVGRTAIWSGVALVVGLAVALPLTLYSQYDRGANMADGWACGMVPKFPFDEAVRVTQRLQAQGALELSESLHGWQRFAHVSTTPSFMLAFGAGLGLVLLFTAARLRFARWPLHPVLFLVWYSSYTGRVFCASFMIGWFIKVMVTKYAGASGYQRLKPLMFGLIAGDMLGGIIPCIIGFVYYLVTGEIPKPYGILPG